MECLGGNGYIEEGNLARQFRDAPVNAIWEGSGNVMCLDVMRVISKGGKLLDAVLSRLEQDLGGNGASKTIEVIRTAASMAQNDIGSARILTEQLALTAAGAELRRLNTGTIADAFIETRLGGLWRSTYGMLDNRHDSRSIIDTLYPAHVKAIMMRKAMLAEVKLPQFGVPDEMPELAPQIYAAPARAAARRHGIGRGLMRW